MTPDQQGLWLVGVDGGVFTVGTAGFYGSLGGTTQNDQTVAIVPTLSGHGYWLIQADGGVANFGDATLWGSLPAHAAVNDVVSATQFSNGYCMFESDGHYECWWGSVGNWTGRSSLGSFAPYQDPLTAAAAEYGQYPCSGQISCGGVISDREGHVYPYLLGTGSGGNATMGFGPIMALSGFAGNGYRLLGADGATYDYGGVPHEGNPTWTLSPPSSSAGATPDAQIARIMLPWAGWGANNEWKGPWYSGLYFADYEGLNALWQHESGWDWWVCSGGGSYPTCNFNGAGGLAYGIPQALPGQKMNPVYGSSWTPPIPPTSPDYVGWAANPWTQIIWGLAYIRYGQPTEFSDPDSAWVWKANNKTYTPTQL